MEVLSVGIVPECYQSYEKNGLKIPFSLNFLMNCINRVQDRVSHKTLPGNGIQSLGVMSLFVKLFDG